MPHCDSFKYVDHHLGYRHVADVDRILISSKSISVGTQNPTSRLRPFARADSLAVHAKATLEESSAECFAILQNLVHTIFLILLFSSAVSYVC